MITAWVLPPTGILQGDSRALPTAPPLVVGEVGLASPPSRRSPAAQGVPSGLPVGGRSQALRHACLQAGLTSLPNQHFRLAALAHHEAVGLDPDFVGIAGKGPGGVAFLSRLGVPDLHASRQRHVGHPDRGRSPTRKKHTQLSTARGPRRGPHLGLTAACTRSTNPEGGR